MRVICGEDKLIAEWVAQRIPHMESGEDFGLCAAIGVVDSQGVIVGGVVYSNYLPQYRSIELSFASDADTPIKDRVKGGLVRKVSSRRWLTRGVIRALLSYPFDQLQCQRVTGVTPRRATSARRFLDHFGFKREGLVRRGFGDDDAVISGLLRTEWQASRWAQPLPERRTADSAGRDHHRQENPPSARRA